MAHLTVSKETMAFLLDLPEEFDVHDLYTTEDSDTVVLYATDHSGHFQDDEVVELEYQVADDGVAIGLVGLMAE